jgi:hypothetical protein
MHGRSLAETLQVDIMLYGMLTIYMMNLDK